MSHEPLRRVLVLLNASAGTLSRADSPEAVADRVRRAFAGHGVEAVVREEPVPTLCDAARGACGDGSFDAVIAGGGDGTLNAVANALAREDARVAFGVLPLGTFNHFAKELDLPLDLEAAVAALVSAEPRPLPVGELNGRIFLNFSSLGLHPEMVRHRDVQRKSRGRSKFLAMIVASLRVLWRYPLLRLRVTVTAPDGRQHTLSSLTPSLVVGNNCHQLRAFGLVGGDYNDRSILNVFLARARGRRGVVWLSIRALFGRLESAESFEALSARSVIVQSRRRHLRVSIDGEVADMPVPLEYRVRLPGLLVLVPTVQAAGAGAQAHAPPLHA